MNQLFIVIDVYYEVMLCAISIAELMVHCYGGPTCLDVLAQLYNY